MHENPDAFLSALDAETKNRTQWVILDRYDLSESFELSLKARGLQVLTIADGPVRRYAADALLDPNLSERTDATWRPFCSASTRILAGRDFLLLREEFWSAPQATSSKVPALAQSFLISMGATDPAGLSLRILEAFEWLAASGSDWLDGARVVLIAGAANPRSSVLEAKCRSLPYAEFVPQADKMRPYLEAADLCIGASGQSTWERFSAGAPSLVAAVAENQIGTLESMERQGLVFSLGWHEALTVRVAAEKIDHAARAHVLRRQMREQGLRQVGGLEFIKNPLKWLEI